MREFPDPQEPDVLLGGALADDFRLVPCVHRLLLLTAGAFDSIAAIQQDLKAAVSAASASRDTSETEDHRTAVKELRAKLKWEQHRHVIIARETIPDAITLLHCLLQHG
eukprot:3336843-Rhodomonas_salina.1